MTHRKIKLIIITAITMFCMSLPFLVLADSPLSNQDLMTRVTLDPTLKPDNAPGVIIGEDTLNEAGAETAFANYTLQMLAGGLITVAAPIAIIIIAIAGLLAVVSHGDQKLIDKAKKTLTWAIIGLILIIFSWIIVRTTISIVIEANPSASTSSQGSGAPSTPADTNSPGESETGP